LSGWRRKEETVDNEGLYKFLTWVVISVAMWATAWITVSAIAEILVRD